MTLTAAYGGQRAFLPATWCRAARCQVMHPRTLRNIKLAASDGFHPDHAGVSSTEAATAPAPLASTQASDSPHSTMALLHLISFIGHLRGHAISLAHHLSNTQHASVLPCFRLGNPVTLPGADGANDPRSEHAGMAFQPLQLRIHVPHLPSRQLGPDPNATSTRQNQQQPHHSADPGQNAGDSQLWVGIILSHVPWPYWVRPNQVVSRGTDTAGAVRPASSFPPPPPSQPGHHDVQFSLTVNTLGIALLWHSAVSLQQRAIVTALWHVGQAVEAADKARRYLPPPAEMPGLVRWGAVAAAARAEETVALALVHTATVASAATASVPASMVASAAVAPPHLPLLHHARRRLLAAATPTLERLRALQRGCTTHVLLRFLLFSAINPRLRRDLRVRLDVLARRAAQVALLQEQHDAWLGRQRQTPATRMPPPPASSGATAPANGHGAAVAGHMSATQRPSAPSASAAGASASPPAPLSARWYRRVFAPEMLACALQLKLEAPGSPPDDQTAGEPPGQFDLRDLYRLIRVIEVAVEDLECYDLDPGSLLPGRLE